MSLPFPYPVIHPHPPPRARNLQELGVQRAAKLVIKGAISFDDLMARLPPHLALEVLCRVPLNRKTIEGFLEVANTLDDHVAREKGVDFVRRSFKGLTQFIPEDRMLKMLGPELLAEMLAEQAQLEKMVRTLKKSGKVLEPQRPHSSLFAPQQQQQQQQQQEAGSNQLPEPEPHELVQPDLVRQRVAGYSQDPSSAVPSPSPVPLFGDAPQEQAQAATGSVEEQPEGTPLSYEELKNGMRWPSWVDPTRREDYLQAREFQRVFGMELAAFHSLPGWKQLRMKKELGLF